jgi:hypothetical protein
MSTPWGMIRARQEAQQAHSQASDMHTILNKLIIDVEIATKELEGIEKSEKVREKLQVAIKNAKDEMNKNKMA